jgi:hypothetical protein
MGDFYWGESVFPEPLRSYLLRLPHLLSGTSQCLHGLDVCCASGRWLSRLSLFRVGVFGLFLSHLRLLLSFPSPPSLSQLAFFGAGSHLFFTPSPVVFPCGLA